MLDASQFQNMIQEQISLGHSITDTLRGMGLDLAPALDSAITEDELILSGLSLKAAMIVGGEMEGKAKPQHYALQGLLFGLALGYTSGLREGTPFDTPETFPADWDTHA